MFWKKKKKDELIDIEAPLFEYDSGCRRENVRVRPLSRFPAQAWLDGEEVEVLDISAGGMACLCHNLKTGMVADLKAHLAGLNADVKGLFEVLAVDHDGHCHGRFVDLPTDMAEFIHQYALRIQKEELRLEKTRQDPDQEEAEPVN